MLDLSGVENQSIQTLLSYKIPLVIAVLSNQKQMKIHWGSVRKLHELNSFLLLSSSFVQLLSFSSSASSFTPLLSSFISCLRFSFIFFSYIFISILFFLNSFFNTFLFVSSRMLKFGYKYGFRRIFYCQNPLSKYIVSHLFENFFFVLQYIAFNVMTLLWSVEVPL